MAQLPAFIVKDINLNVAGSSRIGQARQMTIPQIRMVTEDSRNAGMIKPRAVHMGYEKLTAGFTEVGFDPAMISAFGVTGGDDIIGYGYMESEDGTTHAARIEMNATITEVNPGDWVPGQQGSTEYTIEVHNMTVYVDDIEVLYFDDFDVRVNGEERHRGRRAALRI